MDAFVGRLLVVMVVLGACTSSGSSALPSAKVVVTKSDGSLVTEPAVGAILNSAGLMVVGPQDAPIDDGMYHVDLDTRGIGAGRFQVSIFFDTSTLIGAIRKDITLR